MDKFRGKSGPAAIIPRARAHTANFGEKAGGNFWWAALMPRGDMPSCRRRFFAVPAARARARRRARRACSGLPRLVCPGLPGRAFRHYRQFHRRAYHEKTASGRGNIRMKIETQSEKMRIYLQKGEYLVQTCSVPAGMRACPGLPSRA